MSNSFFKFRLLPLTLIACALFVLVKVDEIAIGQKYLAKGIIPPAYAEASDEAAEEEDKEAAKEAEEDAEEDSEKGEEVAEEAAPAEPENSNVSFDPPEDVVNVDGRYNQIEVDLLQSLSKRREEIEGYEQEVALREKLLDATEMRIDGKIKKMEVMQGELNKLLEQNQVKEDSEMRSLVKIYESMKPKEAARIFNELDMDILLEVIDRMSERKAASVLANMLPTSAKDVTVKLAQMRQIRQKATKDLKDGELAEAN